MLTMRHTIFLMTWSKKLWYNWNQEFLFVALAQRPSYITLKYVNPLYLIINMINGYIGVTNGNKYLALVPTDESKRHTEKVWGTMEYNQRSY